MATFNDFLTAVGAGLKALAQTSLQSLAKEAEADGQAFLTATQNDLAAWTNQLAAGEISKDDFTFLLKAKKDLAEMVLLKQKGLAQIQIDTFTGGVIDLVIAKAFAVFL